MNPSGIHIKKLPQLNDPLLIAGFDGWGNALNVSKGMASFIIKQFKAQQFADLDTDTFYSFDDLRPRVKIEGGIMQSISSPGGAFYAARTEDGHRDIVILSADEPNLRWFQFVDELISLCQKLGISAIITLGSMYDNVLHTDRCISGVASTQAKMSVLQEYGINSISYSGPSAVHSIIQSEGSERDFDCISLWSHCPYYLQGTTHFGILSHLAAMISKLGKIQLDTTVLDANWDKLSKQIDKLINDNSELQSLISDLRKKKLKGSASSLKGNIKSDEKVINLKDFLDPS